MTIVEFTERIVTRVVTDYCTVQGIARLDITDQFLNLDGKFVLRYGAGGLDAEQLRAIADHLEERAAS